MRQINLKNWSRKIRNRIIFGVLLTVSVVGFGTYAIVSNFFVDGKKIEAAPGVSCTGGAVPTCTFSGAGSISWVEGQYENADIIISGIEVISYGRHNINSLYIADGGVLTHDALSYPRDFAVKPGSTEKYLLSSQGKRRKVDLNIAQNLTIENGGKIDVDGKGYPGQLGSSLVADCGNNCGFGYGPGGGESADAHDATAFGGGGGYGGDGGQGRGNDGGGDAGVFPENLLGETYTIDTAWHGSAGGAALKHSQPAIGYSDGRAGGGVVFVQARDIINIPEMAKGGSITARGADAGQEGVVSCISNKRCSGAGSGGSIYLFLRNYSANTKFGVSSDGGVSASAGKSGTDSSPLLSGFSNDVGHLMKVNADGGRAGPSYRYDRVSLLFGGVSIPRYLLDAQDSGIGGGGGRIMIQANNTFMTVEKKIEAVSRGGVVADYNPYSLQENDMIKIKIRVMNIKNGAIVSDVPLKEVGVTGGFICRPVSSSPAAATTNDEIVSWTYAGSDDDEAIFEYNCQIKK